MNIFDILVVNICIGSSVVYDVLVKQWITGETEIRIKFIIWDDYQVLGNFFDNFGVQSSTSAVKIYSQIHFFLMDNKPKC